MKEYLPFHGYSSFFGMAPALPRLSANTGRTRGNAGNKLLNLCRVPMGSLGGKP